MMGNFSFKTIISLLSVMFIGLVLSTSCGRPEIDGRHPLFIKAQNCYNEGNYDDAVKFYKSYLKINPDSAKTIYQLAVIYQEKGEYIQAIFYYEKYLALEPDSSDREIIEKWIISSKEQLLKELEKSIETDSESDEQLKQQVDRLQQQNEEMRKFILRHKETFYPEHIKKTEKGQTKTAKPQNDISDIPRKASEEQVYIVKPGDTLYKISIKFYGTAQYYKLILDKNKNQLKPSSKLMPGDKLTIPSRPLEGE